MSNSEIPKMDAASATRILENVFDECEMKPNSVPIEALSAYSSYRKERFALQKTIIVIAMILFLLLPVDLLFNILFLLIQAIKSGLRTLV